MFVHDDVVGSQVDADSIAGAFVPNGDLVFHSLPGSFGKLSVLNVAKVFLIRVMVEVDPLLSQQTQFGQCCNVDYAESIRSRGVPFDG